MLRFGILALAGVLAVTPALAESTALAAPQTPQGANQALLLDDGTSAMAQAGPDGQRNDFWLGVGMFVIPASILIALGIQSQNKSHAVSP